MRQVFIEKMAVPVSVGVLPREREAPQTLVFSVWMDLSGETVNSLEDTVSYDPVVNFLRALSGRQHVALLETLAEEVAEYCLKNEKVERVRVRIEKPGIYNGACIPGVEIIKPDTMIA